MSTSPENMPPTSTPHPSTLAAFPESGRLAAVDYGTVRIGIAICDPGRILVSPHAVHTRGRAEAEAEFFRRLAVEERVAGFVVGLPIHCDGGESPKSIEARAFARWLHELTGLPTRLFDERFTTAQAQRRLRPSKLTHKHRKQRIDAVAAQVLLEAFLEVAEYTGELPGQAIDAPSEGDESLD
ncbi:Holliday junction resolvase RuvX [Candidatus Laterigemmans baculatus]|uniref:Holliday junction resolvase RuvX n=1 Tax=Candidatus Laterigemmans baculatus TaxID=2770505 RepID=UPI0036F3F454